MQGMTMIKKLKSGLSALMSRARSLMGSITPGATVEPVPASPADYILQRSTLRQPFRNASAAAQEVRDLVAGAINWGYTDMEPRDNGGGIGRAVWETFAVLAVFLVPVASMAIDPALVIPLLPVALGPAWLVCSRLEEEKKPRYQFKNVVKSLSATTSCMPEGSAKTLTQDFCTAAKRAFTMAEIAVLQEHILRGDEDPMDLRRLHVKGLALIDQATKDFHWDKREGADIKAAFREGRLPPAREYRELFDERHQQLQRVLAEITGP
jgi:hypothetical protein